MIAFGVHRDGKVLAVVTAHNIAYSAQVFLKTSANNWDPIPMVLVDEENYQAKLALPEGEKIRLGFEVHFNGDQIRWYHDNSIEETEPSGIGNGINSVFLVPN